MKIYIVVGFKKESGYSMPCYLKLHTSHEAAEQDAYEFDGFATVTTQEVYE